MMERLRERMRRASMAMVTAVVIAVAFEIAWNEAIGRGMPMAYAAFCALSSAGVAGCLALASALLPFGGAHLALWAWVTLCGAYGLGPMGAIFWGVAAAGLMAPGLIARPRPMVMGACASIAATTTLLTWRSVAALWPGLPAEGIKGAILSAALFGFCLLAAVGGVSVASRVTPRRAGVAVAIGLIALAPLLAAKMIAPRGRSWERRLPGGTGNDSLVSVILLVLDTVRADHLSVYGYERETTPSLATFLRERKNVVLFPQTYSPSSWTLPAHASLFTGVMPSEHGIHSFDRFAEGRVSFSALSADSTVAEVYRHRGYHTLAVPANPFLRLTPELCRGFDLVRWPPGNPFSVLVGESVRGRWLPGLRRHTATASEVNSMVLDLLSAAGDAPVFLFANYMDAHAPYAARGDHASRFGGSTSPFGGEPPELGWSQEKVADRIARYDEEISGLDAAIGDLLAELGARGILDRAWVFITSDHGEAFGEHGATNHGTGLHNEQIRVPLIVSYPPGERIDADPGPVGLLDVAETLFELAGAASPRRGRSLLDRSARPGVVGMEFYGARAKVGRFGHSAGQEARAVIAGPHKLIGADGGFELYDLATDPGEKRDLADDHPELVAELALLLPSLADSPPRGGAPPLRLTSKMIQTLRALGYVEE